MSGRKQSMQTRFDVLALAERLQNVSLACKISNLSRAQFYRLKRSYLLQSQNGFVPSTTTSFREMPRIPRETEYLILQTTAQHPTISRSGLVTRLRLDGIKIPGDMVKLVWRKYALTTRAARVAWMGKPDPWKLIEMQMPTQAASLDGSA